MRSSALVGLPLSSAARACCCPPCDADALTDVLPRHAVEPAWHRDLGQATCRRAIGTYDWPRITDRLESLFAVVVEAFHEREAHEAGYASRQQYLES
jgi:hypothetical protein